MSRPERVLTRWAKYHDLSQDRIAEILGCTQPTVSALMRGRCVPSTRVSVAIERAMREWPWPGRVLRPADWIAAGARGR